MESQGEDNGKIEILTIVGNSDALVEVQKILEGIQKYGAPFLVTKGENGNINSSQQLADCLAEVNSRGRCSIESSVPENIESSSCMDSPKKSCDIASKDFLTRTSDPVVVVQTPSEHEEYQSQAIPIGFSVPSGNKSLPGTMTEVQTPKVGTLDGTYFLKAKGINEVPINSKRQYTGVADQPLSEKEGGLQVTETGHSDSNNKEEHLPALIAKLEIPDVESEERTDHWKDKGADDVPIDSKEEKHTVKLPSEREECQLQVSKANNPTINNVNEPLASPASELPLTKAGSEDVTDRFTKVDSKDIKMGTDDVTDRSTKVDSKDTKVETEDVTDGPESKDNDKIPTDSKDFKEQHKDVGDDGSGVLKQHGTSVHEIEEEYKRDLFKHEGTNGDSKEPNKSQDKNNKGLVHRLSKSLGRIFGCLSSGSYEYSIESETEKVKQEEPQKANKAEPENLKQENHQ